MNLITWLQRARRLAQPDSKHKHGSTKPRRLAEKKKARRKLKAASQKRNKRR